MNDPHPPVESSDTAADFWEDESLPLPKGCANCHWYGEICGGIRAAAAKNDCLDLCCSNPALCQVACPNKEPVFTWRLQEVGGFQLRPSKAKSSGPLPSLNGTAPVIYHGYMRDNPLVHPIVAIPLKVIMRQSTGDITYKSREELCKAFTVSPNAKIIISGVAEDPYLERLWAARRNRDLLACIKALQPDAVSTPNFSTFCNRPRHDMLHNQKRIAILYDEMVDAGLPAVLHINAVYRHDWDRWGQYIRDTPTVEAISFEFGTGVTESRAPLYAGRLVELQESAGRDLMLLTQGGIGVYKTLSNAFARCVFLDTSSFTKAVNRRLIAAHSSEDAAAMEHRDDIEYYLEKNVAAMTARISALTYQR